LIFSSIFLKPTRFSYTEWNFKCPKHWISYCIIVVLVLKSCTSKIFVHDFFLKQLA
jgi:hypothetical protein